MWWFDRIVFQFDSPVNAWGHFDPVQGCRVGKGSFNREVDICEWTFERKKILKCYKDKKRRLNNWNLTAGQSDLTDSTASSVRGWGRCSWWEAASGWTHCRDGVSLRALENSHWRYPQSEGREWPKGLQRAEFYIHFDCECGTWQHHLHLRLEKQACSHYRHPNMALVNVLWHSKYLYFLTYI